MKLYLKFTYVALSAWLMLACTADPFSDLQNGSTSIDTENNTTTAEESENEHCFTTNLMAGQHYESGLVTVDVEDGELVITYRMNDNWTIGITHLSVGNCEDGWVPLNGGGNPQIGQFEYTEPFSSSDTEVVYRISLEELGDTICFAAHAEVEGPSGGETAWAEGAQFDGNGWAMYVQTDISECEDQPDSNSGGAF